MLALDFKEDLVKDKKVKRANWRDNAWPCAKYFYDRDCPIQTHEKHGPKGFEIREGEQAYSHNPWTLVEPIKAFFAKHRGRNDCAALLELLMRPTDEEHGLQAMITS